MSFINKLPLTKFNLPTGEEIQTRNLFKTLIIAEESKNDPSIVKKQNGTNVTKIESLGYQLYSDRPPLYWLITHLNDIDSFSKFPIPAAKFETSIPGRFPGMVYYIHEAKNTNFIVPGDIVILFSDQSDPPAQNTWKYAGRVKEYDEKFRRIVLEQQVENTSNSSNLPSYPYLYVYKENGEAVTERQYKIGRMENEYDKIIGIYDTDLNGIELSPFRLLDSSFNLTDEYDFTDEPNLLSIIYLLSLSSGTLNPAISSFYYHTTKKEEIKKNTKNNAIKYLSPDLAYEATTFINTILSEPFKRGQKIIIKE